VPRRDLIHRSRIGQQACAHHNVGEVEAGRREVPHVEGVGARRDALRDVTALPLRAPCSDRPAFG
jgi:hypothetical protein